MIFSEMRVFFTNNSSLKKPKTQRCYDARVLLSKSYDKRPALPKLLFNKHLKKYIGVLY
jgi:hypothetical protein